MSGISEQSQAPRRAPTGGLNVVQRQALAQALPAYEIGEELGRGAWGLVVAARHRRLDREVAIKLLTSSVDPEVGARFLAEARVLAAIDHPHVVPVLDYVEADGAWLLIMERLTGGTVKHLSTTGRVSPPAACAVLVAACEGLHYAHGMGVLHRDVKPQNLLLSDEGVVKVADFGIAKVLAGSTGVVTQTGLMLGTPSYMAPEQVLAATLSPAVDTYAAGVVFYELLCGELPFPAADDAFAAMYQRVHSEPIPLRERAPALPPALAAIADRALRREPGERYPSAGEFGRAVAQAAACEWGPDWLADTGIAAVAAAARAHRIASGAHTPPPDAIAAPAVTAPRPPEPATPSPAARGTLEREPELARIAAALDGAASGSGGLVVIEGPAGIGKTRLIDEAGAMAQARGFGRMTATGYDTERVLAWGVVRQLVERSVLRFAPEVREQILAGPAGRALEALDRAPADTAADEAALAPALHALWWVAADLSAERPVLITIDDAQWADRSSLRFLTYLARRISDLAIALVIATRPADGDDAAHAELVAARGGERVNPAPLSQDAIAVLARARGGAPAPQVARALHEATGGNPFLADQLLAELAARQCRLDDPDTAAVVERLAATTLAPTLLGRLGREALGLAQVLGVAGPRDGPELALELSGLDPDTAGRALDELVAAEVLSDRDEMSFRHPSLREAVLTGITRARRAAIHGAVARDLARRAMPADRVAGHLVLAPPGTLPDAAQWLRAAARALLAAGDATSAVVHLRRALGEEPADPELRAELGEALLAAGQPAEAGDQLRAAARATAAPVERARRLAAAASATLALNGPAAAAAELREHLDAGEGADDPVARVLLVSHLGGVASFDPVEFRRCADRLAPFADLPGNTRDERALLAVLARRGWSDVRPAAEVAAIARRALTDCSWIFEGSIAFGAYAGALHTLVMADDLEPVHRHFDWLRRNAHETSPRNFVLFASARALVAWREGNVEETVAEATATIDAVGLADRDTAIMAMHAVAVRVLVLALVEMGDLPAARQALAAYEAAAVHDPLTIPRHRLRLASAVVAYASGDSRTARAEAEALGAVERSADADNPSVPWRSVAALAAASLGDERAARALASEQLELARAWGAPTDLGGALRVAARLDAQHRTSLLFEAVEVLEQSPCRLELARALHELAGQLTPVDARELLRRAAELARACGSRALLAQVEASLDGAGDSPREVVLSAAKPLSPSERRVAELAVAGRSERDIAQELFVTPKAVENQLSRIYAKLGVHGRAQLSTALTPA